MALRGFFLHLSQYVAHNLPIVILGHVQKLRPREYVVEVVLHLVVFGKAKQIAGLHCQQIIYGRLAYAHHLAKLGLGFADPMEL